MSFSKLKKLHIIIIGAVLCVIAIVAQYFLLVKPKMEEFKSWEDKYKAAAVLGNPQAENQAIAERNAAELAASQAEQSLRAEMERRMPDLSFSDRKFGMLQLWHENIKNLGPLMEAFAHDPNCTSVSGQFNIPTPPLNPNDPIFDAPVLTFQGSIHAQGSTFKSILNNVRRWNNCRRLVMVGPPAISGNTPRLSVAYSITGFIFPVRSGGPQIPMAGPAGSSQ